MTNPKRSTIRLRLTVWYASAFFFAGAILIGLMYFCLDRSLERRPPAPAETVVGQFLGERELRDRPFADRLFSAIAAEADAERRETMRGLLVWSLTSLGVVGVAAGGVGWLLAGRALQPLQQITATARRVADRSLHERIVLSGPDDEIKDLADTFEAMLERLDRAFDSSRIHHAIRFRAASAAASKASTKDQAKLVSGKLKMYWSMNSCGIRMADRT